MNPKTILEKANEGKDLSKDQRRRAVKYLMATEDLETVELADRFDVSYSTVYRDKKAVREELNDQLLGNHSIAGRLMIAYQRTDREMAEVVKEAKSQGDLQQWRLAVRDRFKTAKDFADVIGEMQMLRRLDELEEHVESIRG